MFGFKTIHPVRRALELAVAAATSLFGFNSEAALAPVVGALIEALVLLSVVRIVNRPRDRYEPERPADGESGSRASDLTRSRSGSLPNAARLHCKSLFHRLIASERPANPWGPCPQRHPEQVLDL